MKSEAQAFAVRLAAALKSAGVSDRAVDLEKMVPLYGGAAVSQQAVSNWLHGRNMPSRRNLHALSRITSTDLHSADAAGTKARAVRDRNAPRWSNNAADERAIARYMVLPESRRKLVRELIEAISDAK